MDAVNLAPERMRFGEGRTFAERSHGSVDGCEIFGESQRIKAQVSNFTLIGLLGIQQKHK
jgi:hypothetical protein